MKKFLLLLLLLGHIFMGCQQQHEPKLTIATAANMQFAMQALIQAFSQQTGIPCEMISSSSGKLTAQIKEGAPFDLFVSANMKYPNELFEHGLTLAQAEVYAEGRLVLWSMIDHIDLDIEHLAINEVKHIALANPKIAPYGTAAIELLTHYQLINQLEDKLVYGESIAQTNQFIVSKAVEMGFTAKSVVLSPAMKGKGHWVELDTALYSPIEQGVVIINRQRGQAAQAQQFYAFLFSAQAKVILEQFGYVV